METEYLTLIYLNSQRIHVISCPENGAVYYRERRMRLFLRDESKRVLKGIRRLAFGEGMECPWAGAVHAALVAYGRVLLLSSDYGNERSLRFLCRSYFDRDILDGQCTE